MHIRLTEGAHLLGRGCLVAWLLLRLKQPQQLTRLAMLPQQISTGGAYR